tara:strand:+ start:656 stop:1456 length:801 start_codon:yes stop_codon:yes gene_type:complete
MKINFNLNGNFKKRFLKFIYNGLLTGMPIITYNPITQNTFNAPLTVEPYSIYINLKLDNIQSIYLNNYIKEYSNDLEIVPINLLPNEEKSKYLSINIYNCSSPIFVNNEKLITRCEINTYVYDKKCNAYGTLILDYISNELSMDPINIFKVKDNITYSTYNIFKIIKGESIKEKIKLKYIFITLNDIKRDISKELIKYTDNIYYKNGIVDKLYYDSSLVEAEIKYPILDFNFEFKYKDLVFNKIDNVFYFTKKIKFIGGMWNNINI